MHRLLIVEDDEMLRRSIAELLEDSGYQVSLADNGAVAVKLLQQEANYDALLCDVRMPEIDGNSLLSIVREQYTHIPVIMMTGQGSIESAVQAMREGAVNYLLKPVRRRQLLESVSEAIHVQREQQTQRDLLQQIVHNLQALGVIEADMGLKMALDPTTKAPDVDIGNRFMRVGDIEIDTSRAIAIHDGVPLELTPTEFEILVCLVQAGGQVVSFEDIVLAVQGMYIDRDSARRMLSAHISNLRAKLEQTGQNGLIVSSRGRGYRVEI